MKKQLELDLVGQVAIASGELIAIDPVFLNGKDKSAQRLTEAILDGDLMDVFDKNSERFPGLSFEDVPRNQTVIDQLRILQKHMGSGHSLSNGGQYFACKVPVDGLYPVYASIIECRISGLYIDFENFADE